MKMVSPQESSVDSLEGDEANMASARVMQLIEGTDRSVMSSSFSAFTCKSCKLLHSISHASLAAL